MAGNDSICRDCLDSVTKKLVGEIDRLFDGQPAEARFEALLIHLSFAAFELTDSPDDAEQAIAGAIPQLLANVRAIWTEMDDENAEPEAEPPAKPH